MRRTRRPAATGALSGTLPAIAVLLVGCADFAVEAERVPTEVTLFPDTGLLTVGDPTELSFVVKDQDGEVMSVPSWAPPVWEVSPAPAAEVAPDGTLTGKRGAWLTVTARLGEARTQARFRMNPRTIRLTAPVIYLTQAAQNRGGTVQLIAGRPALLRVFAMGDQVNWLEAPAVKVTLLRNDSVVFERLLPPETPSIPSSVVESDLLGSYDVEVPGALVHGDVSMVVELDPEGVVPLAPGSTIRYPEEGSTRLEVVEPQLFRQIFVPTIELHSPDESVYDWTDGVSPESPHLRFARTVLPVGTMEVEVHETYRTNADLSTGSGWSAWIRDMAVLFEDEGRRGYYYGVASISQPAYGGLGYVGYPVSVGLPVPEIYAHELGHNMNLSHAPCGNAGGPDPNYPNGDGSIGIWGYDLVEDRLFDPGQYKDVMGYCGMRWISDYHFNRATDHRLDGDGGVDLGGGAMAHGGPDGGEMLVVWGSVEDGRLTLDPSFVVDGGPVLPEAEGPYRVEGLDADGRIRFSLSFTPTPLEFGGGGFVFFVPYEREWADDLDRIVLTGPEGESIVTRGGEPPLAVVRDRSTGRIRAILRGWDGGPIPGEGNAEVTISRGIPASGPR